MVHYWSNKGYTRAIPELSALGLGSVYRPYLILIVISLME